MDRPLRFRSVLLFVFLFTGAAFRESPHRRSPDARRGSGYDDDFRFIHGGVSCLEKLLPTPRVRWITRWHRRSWFLVQHVQNSVYGRSVSAHKRHARGAADPSAAPRNSLSGAAPSVNDWRRSHVTSAPMSRRLKIERLW
jgi:hypothetical protein